MEYKTFAEIKTKVEMELDLETEDFIQDGEFKQYVNDAIEVVQAEIQKLGMQDDYYLTKLPLTLIQNQADYSLPTNIYMNQIKAIIYKSGQTVYPIKQLRTLDRFYSREIINLNGSTQDLYKYQIRNDSPATKPVIEFIPPAMESGTLITLWYHRSANKWTTLDSEYCDIPEIALNYLYAYVAYRCYDKEGHSNTPEAKERALLARQLMIDTMTNMIPDEDSELIKDMSYYNEMS